MTAIIDSAGTGRRTVSTTTVSRRTTVLVGVAATIVFALGSWIPSLWGDEAASLMSAERPLPSLLAMLGHVDAVHGTYYLGLHVWIHLVGTSSFALRLPAAFAGGACAAAVFALGSMLRGARLGYLAAAALVLIPRMTNVAEDTRSYAFSAAIAAWATVLLVVILRRARPGRRLFVAYAILLALGTYTFLYTILLVLAHGIVVLVSRPGRPIGLRWCVAVACAVLAVGPLLAVAYAERGQVAYLGRRVEVTPHSVLVTTWFGSTAFAAVAWVLIAVAVLGGLAAALRDREMRLDPRRPGEATAGGRLELVAATWLAIPSAVVIGAQFVIPAFSARYLAFCAPAAALLIAAGIDRLLARSRAVAMIAVTAGLVAGAPIAVQQRGPYADNRSDWAEIGSTMGRLAVPGDGVVFDDAVRPSRRTRLASRTYPRGFDDVSDVTLRSPFAANAGWTDTSWPLGSPLVQERLTHYRRVWLIDDAHPGTRGTDGLANLLADGYHEGLVLRLHSSVIRELQR